MHKGPIFLNLQNTLYYFALCVLLVDAGDTPTAAARPVETCFHLLMNDPVNIFFLSDLELQVIKFAFYIKCKYLVCIINKIPPLYIFMIMYISFYIATIISNTKYHIDN